MSLSIIQKKEQEGTIMRMIAHGTHIGREIPSVTGEKTAKNTYFLKNNY